MKTVKALFCLLAITLFSATLLPSARADEWNKKTVVTFSQAVEVPGKVLPAGTYTFQLMDSPSDRHIVQIFRADEWNKKTVVTFSQAVEVPGKVLPAGTYTFQLMDSPSDRHIVQIFNA